MFYSKKGSTSVFLVIILASVLLIASVLIRAAGLAAGRSCGDAVFLLAGRSVLSEFDRKLFDDYGILAMRADDETVKRKLRYYSDASLKKGSGGQGGSSDQDGSGSSGNSQGGVWLLPCNPGDFNVYLKEYSLTDINSFEAQIIDDVKRMRANHPADYLIPGGTSGGVNLNPSEYRKIGNQAIIGSLPSHGVSANVHIPPVSSILARRIPALEELSNIADNISLTTDYILARFTTANAKIPKFAGGHEQFFRNEAEYVVAGCYDDTENYNGIIDHLKQLRFALNENALRNDSGMIREVNDVCLVVESIVPADPWAFFIRDLVIAAWCAVETRNDIELIERGEKVPIHKKRQNWATGAGGVIAAIEVYALSGHSPSDYEGIKAQALYETRDSHAIKPGSSEGFTYNDYLRLYLYYTPRDVKLLRIMDLIQLNMKVNYYSDFLIREHYTGFRYQVVMNKDTYSYEQKYRK